MQRQCARPSHPTARFMGGREFAALLHGAPADLGTPNDVAELLQNQTMALPSFSPHGGPFMHHTGKVLRMGQPVALQDLPLAHRSALASLYCAQITSWLAQLLRPTAPTSTIVIEGPLAHNKLYLAVLQALRPTHPCQASLDTMEGTARGAWSLTRWHQPPSPIHLQNAPAAHWSELEAYQTRRLLELDQLAEDA